MTQSWLLKHGLVVILAALLAGSMWFYFLRILVPYERSDAAAHDRPRGNLSDLYPRWLGSRELLLHHRNPYRPDITREIQAGYYGRILDRNRPGDPKDQQAFAYPAYVAFLLAPTVTLPFERVRAGFGWLLAALTAASVWLWLRALRWQPSSTAMAVILILSFGSFPVIQGLRLEQLSLLVAALLAAAAVLLLRGQTFAAGAVLALATIKPQMVAPLLLCLFLWVAADWAGRRGLLEGFALTIALLVGGAELLLPGWIADFRGAIRDYYRYAGGQSSLDLLLSPAFGRPAAIVVVCVLLGTWWGLRQTDCRRQNLALLFTLTLAATLIVIPTFASYNQVLLLPAIFVLLGQRHKLWKRGPWSRAACLLVLGVLGWSWVASAGLTLAALVLSPEAVERGWKIPLATTPAIPFACLLLLVPVVAEAWRRSAHPV
jgi:hypothetical protein